MRLPRPSPPVWFWLLAVLLGLGEFLLFDRMTSRHHASVYPRWNDQIQYLSEAYRGFEDARAGGVLHGLRTTLTNPAAQGTLHDVAALGVFLLVGSASRSAALSLNILAFIAWQLALLGAFRRASGSWTVGWLAFGLLAAVYWPWSGEAASAVDFRLDHAAMCLFGVTAATALLTRGFRATGWSLAFGAGVGLTLMERHLTLAYFGPIFAAAAGWILCGPEKRARLLRLAGAAAVAALIAAPFFWLNWRSIQEYYWAGHVTSAEAAARAGGHDVLAAGRLVFGQLVHMQLGGWFWRWTLGLTAGLALFAAVARFRTAGRAAGNWHRHGDWLFLALVFLLSPAVVLIFHRQQSPYVLGILVPGTMLLCGWLWAVLWPGASSAFSGRAWPALLGSGLALLAVWAGGRFFVGRQLWQPHSPEFLASAARVNQLARHFLTRSQAAGLDAPRIGVDQVTDALDAQIMRVVGYERTGVWMPYRMPLPTSILAERDEVIFERLAQCDFMLLTDEMPGHGHWPYDQQMRRLYPELRRWCDAHLRAVETFSIFGRRMTLFEHRDLPALPNSSP